MSYWTHLLLLLSKGFNPFSPIPYLNKYPVVRMGNEKVNQNIECYSKQKCSVDSEWLVGADQYIKLKIKTLINVSCILYTRI